MHTIEFGYGLQFFMNIWQKNVERNPNFNLRNANDFYIPIPRVDSFKYTPLYSFPKEWNNLPEEIKPQFNRYLFKSALKQHLFNLLIEESA
jgi:hypothetical protein